MTHLPATLLALLLSTSFAGLAQAHAGHDHGGATAPAEAAEPAPAETAAAASGNSDGVGSCGNDTLQPAGMAPDCSADCTAVRQVASEGGEAQAGRPADCGD